MFIIAIYYKPFSTNIYFICEFFGYNYDYKEECILPVKLDWSCHFSLSFPCFPGTEDRRAWVGTEERAPQWLFHIGISQEIVMHHPSGPCRPSVSPICYTVFIYSSLPPSQLPGRQLTALWDNKWDRNERIMLTVPFYLLKKNCWCLLYWLISPIVGNTPIF